MSVYHYTIGYHMPEILESGMIELATALVPKDERPAAWFTTRDDWEPTCNRGVLDPLTGDLYDRTREHTEREFGGLFRIAVDPGAAPHNWTAFRKLSGIDSRFANALKESAEEIGSDVLEWRVSFEPVPSSKWLAVERWNGTAWVPLETRA